MENEEGFIDKYKTKVIQVIFKLFKEQSLRKSQRRSRENNGGVMQNLKMRRNGTRRNDKAVQTNPIDEMDKVKFLETDYAKILK